MKKFDWLDSRVKFIATVLTIVVGLITVFSKIDFFYSEIREEDVLALLKNKDSFVKNNDIGGLLALFHEDFVITVTHPNGRVESLNLDQYKSHFDMIANMPFSTVHDDLAIQISHINENMVLISQVIKQSHHGGSKLVPRFNTKLFQSTVVVKDRGKLKFFKASSIAEEA
ncbi:hypothetical protein ACJJIU_10340 [Microbulbifer sp. CnH-101-E]|uniref:hypothetical protein n=1 Tax=unclassified Microbulbifer TaxID=2619833 RepID=UPI00403924B0